MFSFYAMHVRKSKKKTLKQFSVGIGYTSMRHAQNNKKWKERWKKINSTMYTCLPCFRLCNTINDIRYVYSYTKHTYYVYRCLYHALMALDETTFLYCIIKCISIFWGEFVLEKVISTIWLCRCFIAVSDRRYISRICFAAASTIFT